MAYSLKEGASSAYRLTGVTKRLEKAGMVFELCIPHFEIKEGEIAAIVGESGCGKSTLLDLLGLISSPSSQTTFEMTFDRSVESLADAGETRLAAIRRQYLGYVLQNGGLLPFLSVGENIRLSQRIAGIRLAEQQARLLASSLGIEEHWKKKPAFLSGGQRQRVAIARALAHQPSIILADEPTGAVDRVTAREIRDLLCQVSQARGATVIIVSHDWSLFSGQTVRAFTFRVVKTAACIVQSTLVETDWKTLQQSASTA